MISMDNLFDIVATEARDGSGPECIDFSRQLDEVHQQLISESIVIGVPSAEPIQEIQIGGKT